ncbi:phage holin family protein [Paludibacterium purpuratum]|uniref:Putative 3TM holin n=1 Tax=Paludibacterium purpuratum TaxID=1144873 RepID=A0A4R7B8W3_9NEIS|nr:phage holin family protein [Paludibacterium purpuratum]TDR80205.1 putative 3TM holin [Paludibacterium purpuratum]
MNLLDLINDLLCGACCLRLILFTRSEPSRHRPWASALAYLLIVAFCAIVILPWLDRSIGIGVAQLLLNGVLVAALFSSGGNVTRLFQPRIGDRPSIFSRVLERKTWL